MNRIIRIKSEKGFTIIPNTVFSSGLSLRAMGLITFILHLPDDWVLYKSYLYENMKEGRDAIKSAWSELEDKGYIKTVTEVVPGKGNLRISNYFVYDSPSKSADFPSPETRPPEKPQPKTRPSKTRPLLSTNQQNTNVLSTIPLIPNGINGAEVPPVVPPKPPKPEKPEHLPMAEFKTYPKFIEAYDTWYKQLTGVPPNIDAAGGKAAKLMIVYFRKISKSKAEERGELLNALELENRLIISWEHVLKNWDKLDNFLQNKTKLVEINGQIQNIVNQIKNGKKTGNDREPTGGAVQTIDLASAIANSYSTS